MAAKESLAVSIASVVEDVLQQHGYRNRGIDLESRRAEEAASRRNEAASWLRKMIGVVAARDLPAEPSEEEFRLGLRSGLILCNVLNKVQPGAVSKVVESSNDSTVIPDGAALSAYQYFENVRNFLDAAEELALPTFEASDLEQGGISARVVNSVLALKSYYEWKQSGSIGVWKFGGNAKPTTTVKQFVRKNSEPFTNSLSRTSSMNESSCNTLSHDIDINKSVSNSELNSRSLSALIHALLSDKKPEEVPQLIESVLSKVVEEFEHRIPLQGDTINRQRQTTKDTFTPPGRKPFFMISNDKRKVDDGANPSNMKPETPHNNPIPDEESKRLILKQQMIFDRQGKDLQGLKQTLSTTKAGMQFMQVKFQEELRNLGMHIHGLAHAASGYHKVLEENRKLYNEVQDLKGSIRVYCRIRPFLNGQSAFLSTVESIEEGCLTIKTPSKYGKGHKAFNFNKVFGPSATQAEVFSDMQPLIRSVLDGFNVCIFAYGQTGSGKTHTMSGPRDLTEQSQGVNYRSLSDLFYLADQRRDTFHYDISVQMIEIYNEQVRDLLANDGVQKRLEIRNSSQNGVNVPDASLVRVSSTYDVINLMNIGLRNRAVGSTALNDRSSRSHSCLTVHVQGRDFTSGNVLRGCMHLVDLAGSERVDKSEVTGDRLKEAQHINKSLSALGDVIASLSQKNSHVPYRNSKLTQLLQDSLGGQAKTLMFVHISPETDAVGETISTLKFAERVATVELGAARVNKDSSTDVKELKEQIVSLRAALARKEAEQSFVSPDLYRSKAASPSPLRLDRQGGEMMADSGGYRQPIQDLGNIEVHTKSAPRQKRQSFDLDELLRTSPPWPPVNSPGDTFREDDKETSSGEWVDKVMVNKLDGPATPDQPLPCWSTDNIRMPDSFYQEPFSDPSKLFPHQSFNMFSGTTQFDNADELDEIDAATSDSSEADLLWQFNHSKLPTQQPNGFGSKTKRPTAKTAKSANFSPSMIPTQGPSPSRKLTKGAISPLQRNGRQQLSTAEAKRKNGNRK